MPIKSWRKCIPIGAIKLCLHMYLKAKTTPITPTVTTPADPSQPCPNEKIAADSSSATPGLVVIALKRRVRYPKDQDL